MKPHAVMKMLSSILKAWDWLKSEFFLDIEYTKKQDMKYLGKDAWFVRIGRLCRYNKF